MSSRALLRKPSPIRALTPLLKTPGLISLGGGLPAANLFPFTDFSFSIGTGETLKISGDRLKEALQYSGTYGLEDLISLLKEHQIRVHQPPNVDWNILITTGSQDALSKAFSTLLSEGDTILTEDPTYSGALADLRPLGVNVIGIPSNHEGIIPEEMDRILLNFSTLYPNFKRPHLLYTIPTGQNPSGSTASMPVRKAVYGLACKHNLVLLEDDPYWNLRLLTEGNNEPEPLTSYFSMDIEGRVIRFDSFSKILSAGPLHSIS
uniref:Aminotransferase class I/classII large domain-containing protein n=1 Tax=Arcella intermedia TaxID=1963864 RepID=A0A6B2LDW0_9EUKA